MCPITSGKLLKIESPAHPAILCTNVEKESCHQMNSKPACKAQSCQDGQNLPFHQPGRLDLLCVLHTCSHVTQSPILG